MKLLPSPIAVVTPTCQTERIGLLDAVYTNPCPGEAEVVLAGTAHDDVVQDTHPDVLEGLHDLVGGVDVLL